MSGNLQLKLIFRESKTLGFGFVFFGSGGEGVFMTRVSKLTKRALSHRTHAKEHIAGC